MAWNGAGFARLSGPETAWLAIGSDSEYATLMSERNSIFTSQKVIVCDTIPPDLLMNWQYNLNVPDTFSFTF